jgi:methenyltetrahydromethanopterin cyclohydrolase
MFGSSKHLALMNQMNLNLNARAVRLVEACLQNANALRIQTAQTSAQATVIDLGSQTPGGLNAGEILAQICLADLARVATQPGNRDVWQGPWIGVTTDHPVLACLGSQYAGWQLSHGKFFALGSGPMRAAARKEELFTKLGYVEQAEHVVGVLETRKLPPPEVIEQIITATGAQRVTLLVAPTASLAGNVQIVARSVETALHKLFELGFDVSRLVSGYGVAPLPPVAKDDLAGIGRTNDAILYGAEVTLWVRGDDESLAEIGAKVPSRASRDHGQPFGEIFKRYNYNFYDIDPHLFSPAVITLHNLDTGRTHRFGEVEPALIARSFLA